MAATTIITMAIYWLVAFIMMGIGISNLHSKSPVGFYTGERPPKEDELTDAKTWNRKHGQMWIFYGVVILMDSVIGSLAGDGIWLLLTHCGGVLLPLPVMVWYHHQLIKKYRIKHTK